MPNVPAFMETGTFNLRDLDTDLIVGKVHVEPGASDAAGGRGFVVHWAIIKVSTGETGFGVWSKPTKTNNKRWKWEGSDETLTDFLNWMQDSSRKAKIRYLIQGCREQDGVP